jgi:methionine biosynthesis protein MetW
VSGVHRFYVAADLERVAPAAGPLPAVQLFDAGSRQRLLDIGCYDGSKTAEIRDHLGSEHACGVDFLDAPLEAARRRGIDVRRCDLNADTPIEFDDGMFDCIYVGDVIEHVFSPDHVLREAHRLLRVGGYAVVTTPNLASWRNRVGLLLGWQPLGSEVSTAYRVGNPFMPPGLPAGHLRLFTPHALTELAARYGFACERLVGYGGVPPRTLGGALLGLLDRLSARLRPTLCDELAVRLRRQ